MLLIVYLGHCEASAALPERSTSLIAVESSLIHALLTSALGLADVCPIEHTTYSTLAHCLRGWQSAALGVIEQLSK